MNFNFPSLADRFIRYAKIDTQADPYSNTSPSTEKQKNLSNLLLNELKVEGIKVEQDQFGYIYAELPSNSDKNLATICFCAHMDTAPDCSGTNVKPILHKNYQGEDIILPDDPSIKISVSEFPELLHKTGQDIITASGLTLLGSDDKSGITAIMEALIFLHRNPQIKHGIIKALFTTDEEIGRGVNHVDLKKLAADYCYTMDSGDVGYLEDETFSADACSVIITGVSTHPGYAKNRMENAIKIASEIIAALPKDKLSPETTEHKEGYIHPIKLEAQLESAKIDFIIRDFVTSKLNDHVKVLKDACEKVIINYPNSKYTLNQTEQYRNMKEVLVNHPQVMNYAVQAIQEAGIPLRQGIIRGGTDGSRLSFMGLPCPNIFAGEHGIHSKKEWTTVQDMEKAAEVIIRICNIWQVNS
ncbi:MAG: peptidase T [Saprospiraceae bacterium]